MKEPKTFAYWVTQVGSPPMMGIFGSILVGATAPKAWWGAILYIVMAILAPTGYLFWMYKQGKVTDLHLKVRQERIVPTLVTIGGTAVAWLILIALDMSEPLLVFVLGQLIHTSVFLLITFYWQISIHTSTATTVAVWAALWTGPITAVVFASLILIIAWSRLRLRRHTPWQVVFGFVLGATTMYAAFWIYLLWL